MSVQCLACMDTGCVEDPSVTDVERACLCGGGPGPYGERPCSRCGGYGVIREQADPRVQCPACELRGYVAHLESLLPRWIEALPDDETTWPGDGRDALCHRVMHGAYQPWTYEFVTTAQHHRLNNGEGYICLAVKHTQKSWIWPGTPGERLFWQPFPDVPSLTERGES